jgi:hypothetical protein
VARASDGLGPGAAHRPRSKRGRRGASGSGARTVMGRMAQGRRRRGRVDDVGQGNRTGDWNDGGGLKAGRWQSGGTGARPTMERTARAGRAAQAPVSGTGRAGRWVQAARAEFGRGR